MAASSDGTTVTTAQDKDGNTFAVRAVDGDSYALAYPISDNGDGTVSLGAPVQRSMSDFDKGSMASAPLETYLQGISARQRAQGQAEDAAAREQDMAASLPPIRADRPMQAVRPVTYFTTDMKKEKAAVEGSRIEAVADVPEGTAADAPVRVVVTAPNGKAEPGVMTYGQLQGMLADGSAMESGPVRRDPEHRVAVSGASQGQQPLQNPQPSPQGTEAAAQGQPVQGQVGTVPTAEPARPSKAEDFEGMTEQETESALYGDGSLSEEERESFVRNRIASLEKELARLEKNPPKMGDDIEAYKRDRAAHEEKKARTRRKKEYWERVESLSRTRRNRKRLEEEAREAVPETEEGTEAMERIYGEQREPVPVGRGAFGYIYDQFRGRPREAVDFLREKQDGEAVGVLHHEGIGDISLVWGNEKAGLKKILSKHPEVVDDLQGVLEGMKIVEESENRFKLESPTHFAVVSRDFQGNPRSPWLLTAYGKKETSMPANSRMDVDSNPEEGKPDGTATRQGTDVSGDKVTKNSGIIPLDDSGNPMYEQAPVQATWDDLMARNGRDEGKVRYFAQEMKAVKDRELKAERKKKPKGKNAAELQRAMDERQSKIGRLEQESSYWDTVLSMSYRAGEAAATEGAKERQAEAGRKREESERGFPAIQARWESARKEEGMTPEGRKARLEERHRQRQEAETEARERLAGLGAQDNGEPDYHRSGERGAEAPTEAEAELRDAIVGRLRASGIEVVTDSEAGQRVLDEANGKALHEENKRTNDRFNQELQRQIEGVLPSGHVYKLGMPSPILLSTKIPNLPIELSATHLKDKSKQGNHPFDLSDVANLPEALRHPIAIFEYGDKAKAQNIIVELQRNGKNYLVGLHLNQTRDGIEIHSIRGLFPKDTAEWLNWISQDKALYLDKKKIQGLISQQRINLADVEYLDLDRIANLINDFQNPKLPSQAVREQRVSHGSGADFDHFDFSYMGTGEGAQFFGYGGYCSQVDGIAVGYAEASAGEGYLYKGVDSHKGLAEEIIMTARLNGETPGQVIKSLKKFALESNDMGRLIELAGIKESDFERPVRYLYTLEIPDDNGSNYLHWEKEVPEAMQARIIEQFYSLPKEELDRMANRDAVFNHLLYDALVNIPAEDGIPVMAKGGTLLRPTTLDNRDIPNTGKELYKRLSRWLGGDKAASEFLSKAGFTGISYPAEYLSGGRPDGARNFVIFKESDMKITGKVKFFRTPQGEAYGFTVGGKIYLDPRIAKADTPIHEYAHLWASALREGNPEEWRNVVRLMKGTPVWEEVKKLYPELETDEEIADEVLATYSGRRGAERLREPMREAGKEDGLGGRLAAMEAVGRVREALQRFWHAVADFLHIRYSTAEEVADRVLKDLLDGVKPGGESQRLRLQSKDEALFSGLTPEARAEMETIKAKAEADGTYMKAPNGKPTNLSERQWLQVRTKAFKEWFGDWEKAARIAKLRKSEPVSVEYKGEYELNRESAKEWLKGNVRDEYTNEDTGETIEVSRVGINEVTSHGSQDEAHLKSLVAIPRMLKESIFIDEIPNAKDHDKYDSYRYYVCGLKIDEQDYTAKIVVGVKGDKKYYDHRLTQIEKGALIDNLNGLSNSVAENQNADVSIGKDTRLHELLQADASKVVDGNGEPLVVYHGTPLRRDQITPNRGWQRDGTYVRQKAPFHTFKGGEYSGMIFTSVEAAKARSIAEKRALSIPDNADGTEQWTEEGYVYDLFVNVKNPFVPQRDAEGILSSMGANIPTLSFYGGEGESVPLDVAKEILESGNSWIVTETPQFIEKVRESGYDGLYGKDEGVDYIACFAPNQLKDAYENNGAFSAMNDDIRFRQQGGRGEATDMESKRAAVEALGRKLNVEVVFEDEASLRKQPRQYRTASGWFDRAQWRKDGRRVIHVNLSNTGDAHEAEMTVLHEAVGHMGLRELLGAENYDPFLDMVHGIIPEAQAGRLRALVFKGHPDLARRVGEGNADAQDVAFTT